MTKKESFALNYLAIQEILNSFKEKRTPAKYLLKRFQGYGGLKEILLDPYNLSHWSTQNKPFHDDVLKLHELIKTFTGSNTSNYDSMINSLKSSTLTAYYTPNSLINVIVPALLDKFIGYENINILEPSAGKGDFIEAIIKQCPEDQNYKITAIEKDNISSAITKGLFPTITTLRTGLETASVNNNYFDLVISNIPFGNYKVYDSTFKLYHRKSAKTLSQQKIHNYFFIKGIELTRPNGILAFITTTGFTDSSSNQVIREEMIKESTLLSALRLDNEIFVEAGTKVNTDLLIFQKRTNALIDLEKQSNTLTDLDKKFLQTRNINYLHNDGIEYSTEINSIFCDGAQINNRVLAQFDVGYMFDKKQIVYMPYESEIFVLNKIAATLERDLSKVQTKISVSDKQTKSNKSATLQLDLFSALKIDDQKETATGINKDKDSANPISIDPLFISEYGKFLKEGNIIVINDIPGRLNFGSQGPEIVPLIHKNETELHKYKIAAELLLTYKNLIYHESEQININLSYQLRQSLNTLYDEFNERYGYIHDPKNRYFIDLEPDAIQLLSLERYNNQTKRYDKADIFEISTFQPSIAKELSIEDAISSSLNQFGFVSLEYIEEVTKIELNEITNYALVNDLLYPDPIFHPKTDFTQFKPSQSIEYRWVPLDDFLSGPIRHKISQLEHYPKNLYATAPDKLQLHLYKLRNHDLSYLSINEIDPQLGEQWIPDHIYKDFASQFFQTDNLNFLRSNSTGSYKIKILNSKINTTEYRVDCVSGHKLTGQHLLEYAMAGNKPVITYKVKIGNSTKSFIDKQATTSAALKIDSINQGFTSFIQAHEDYSKYLENIYNNTQNLIVNKTFNGSHLTLPGLQHFELGVHQKDAVWQTISNNGCLNDHIVGAGKSLIMICSAMEMKRLGVSNKTLIIGLKANTSKIYDDFMVAYPNARVLCPNVKDFTPGKRMEYFHTMMNNDWDCVLMTHEQFSAIPQSREIQMDVIQQELRNINLDLEEMHGDQTTDRRILKGLETRKLNMEASLKNLSESLRKDPNMITFDKMGFGHLMVDESQEFKNLAFTTRFNRVAGLGDPKGSARALNLLFAIRTIQKYHGDDKGVTFCSGTPLSNSLVELYSIFKYLTPSELERRRMTNFDSWARTYAKMSTEYELSVTNEIKVKERFRTFLKVPELAAWYRSFANIATDETIVLDKPSLKKHLVEIEPTHTQQTFALQIIDAVKSEDFSFVNKHFTKEQLQAKMLIATNLASKMSLDMRSLDNTYTINDGSKLIEAASKIADFYQISDSYKGTQLVFCDIETPSGVNAALFNVYQALKDILVNDYKIPEAEIQFIHDHDNNTRKKGKFFDAINNGDVRITFGSTKKMGVGVNVQSRVVAMHHLDIPWTPKDISQRNGRGARQGNLIAKEKNNNIVDTFFYATKGTLDAYRYFLVDLKQNFINQIKAGSIKNRTIDEGDIDSDGSMSPAAFIARLSGKEELLEKSKVDQKIADVQTKITVLKTEKLKAENNVSSLRNLIPKSINLLELHNIDKDLFHKEFTTDNEGKPLFTFIDNSITLIDRKQIGEHLFRKVEALHKAKKFGRYLLGNVGPFELNLIIQKPSDDEPKRSVNCIYSVKSTVTELSYPIGLPSLPPPGSLARYGFDALKDIELRAKRYIEQIDKMKTDLKFDQERLPNLDITKFDSELEKLQAEAKRLNDIIDAKDPNTSINPIDELYSLVTDKNEKEVRMFLKDNKFSLDKLTEMKEFIQNHPAISKASIKRTQAILEEFISKKASKKNKSI